MVNDTRSESKIRNEVVDNSLMKKLINGKDSLKVRLSLLKSKHLDIRIPPSSSSTTCKSERFEKHNMVNPLRRSINGKTNATACSSDLKQCAKELSSSEKMKQKKLIQEMGESDKSEVQPKSFCGKRKKMTAHRFKARFKKPRIPGTSPGSNSSQSSQRENISFASSPNQMAVQSSLSSEVDKCQAEQSSVLSDDQKSLLSTLQNEIKKLCQILKLSEVVTHKVRKFLEFVILTHQLSKDSPEIMQAHQISLCWIAASISKQTEVHKRESLELAKHYLNYQCTEEQVHTIYSKMLDLKRIFLQCCINTTAVGRDCLSGEEDINNETFDVNEGSNPNKEKSPFPSCKLKIVKIEIEKDSPNGRSCGREIQPTVAPKDKGAGTEIHNIMNKIQKKCDKRLKKLESKQKKEIQNFRHIWEEKILKAETDHKLESAIIRSIHGRGLVTEDKLKMLKDNFATKMKENNLLKDMQLKDLEAQQLASRNEEREKQANWLAKAKACATSEVWGLCQQSGEEAGFSKSSEHILGDRGSVSITADMADTTVGAAAEEVGCIVPIETSCNLININQENVTGETCSERSPSLAVEQLNQPKHFGTGEIISLNLLSCDERVSDGLGLVELNEEVERELPVIVSNETADNVNSVGLTGASDKGDAAGLPLAGRSEQTEASPNGSELRPPQVPDDQIRQSLVSAEVQDQCAQAVEKQNTFLFEVAQSEIIGTATVLHSNLALQNQNALSTGSQSTPLEVANMEVVDSIISVQSHKELNDQAAPVLEDQSTSQIQEPNLELFRSEKHTDFNVQAQEIEECNQLHPVIYISPDQSSVTEIEGETHALGRNSSQTAEAAEIEVLPHEGASQIGLDLEIQGNHIDMVSGNRIDCETSVQPSASPQNASMSQGTLRIEEPNLEQVGTETHTQSNVQAQETENCNQLHPVINISPDQSPVIEIADESDALGINSSQTAEPAETEVFPHQFANQVGIHLEIPDNHIDMVSVNRIGHETSVQPSASTQSIVSMSQGVNVDHLFGSSNLFSNPNHRIASCNRPPFFAEPLQNELDKIRRETEQLQKSHDDMASKLRSDCEKEIVEIIAQIRNKYEMKLQDAKADFILKKNGLDMIKNKFFMNKVLAEVISYNCMYRWEPNSAEQSFSSSGLQQMQQVTPSNAMQRMHQQPLQHSERHHPTPGQQITSQTVQSMQQPSLPLTGRLHQPPHQLRQHPVSHTNAMNSAGNLPFSGPFYPPVQSIQALRPSAASSIPPSSVPRSTVVAPQWGPLLGVPLQPWNPQNRPHTAPFDPSQIRML